MDHIFLEHHPNAWRDRPAYHENDHGVPGAVAGNAAQPKHTMNRPNQPVEPERRIASVLKSTVTGRRQVNRDVMRQELTAYE